ncbi:MAG: oxidoreductase [Bacteroidetes bacterium]|nr:oxidoreductase [Bacteroidota bacterium]
MRVLLAFLLFPCLLPAQNIRYLDSAHAGSLRGLCPVDDKVIWVSGAKGSVGRSTDGGKTWKWLPVPGYETRDFRDIEAFDAATAIIMAIAEPAVILKTVDGGAHWKLVYENKTPGMFLDAMEFWNDDSGIVLGDPVKGRFFIARTFDGGAHWQEIPFDKLPAADSGEACFASSGTNVRALTMGEACFISGGTKSRFFSKGAPIALPLLQGKETTGANSIAIRDHDKRSGSNYFVIVGGDFMADSIRTGNCILSTDGGKTWKQPQEAPHGYRSCVEFIDKNSLLTCGLHGVDLSKDGGMHWKLISNEGFHVCRKAKNGKSVFLAGSRGRIAKFEK